MSIEKWATKIFDFRKWHVATNANALTLRPLSGAERTLVSHPRGLVSEFTPEFQTLPLVFIQRFSIPSCAGCGGILCNREVYQLRFEPAVHLLHRLDLHQALARRVEHALDVSI